MQYEYKYQKVRTLSYVLACHNNGRQSMTTMTLGEHTPLLIARSDTDVDITRPQRTGSASVSETVINIAKTCMGTGTLALPYAAGQGGLLLHVLGLIAIGAWNLYSVDRLLHCLELMPVNKDHHRPPEGTATLGKVAWHALGRTGLYALDVIMVMLLSGIVITYEGKNELYRLITNTRTFHPTSHS